MQLYRRGQQEVPAAQKEMAKQILTARVQAGIRVGDSLDARLSWVLTFLQRDLDVLSPGDWLNLCDEIRMYGSPLPTGFHGYYVIDIPKGRTSEELQRHAHLPRKQVQQAQRHLLQLVNDLLAGKTVTTVPLSIRLAAQRHPSGTSIAISWTGDPLHLLLFRFLTDLQAAEITRLRQCERGQSAEDRELGLAVCGRWFYARDLRQHFCSPVCGKEGRWTRYWQANREKINRRRRKDIER
jgi:hypothetical protein